MRTDVLKLSKSWDVSNQEDHFEKFLLNITSPMGNNIWKVQFFALLWKLQSFSLLVMLFCSIFKITHETKNNILLLLLRSVKDLVLEGYSWLSRSLSVYFYIFFKVLSYIRKILSWLYFKINTIVQPLSFHRFSDHEYIHLPKELLESLWDNS